MGLCQALTICWLRLSLERSIPYQNTFNVPWHWSLHPRSTTKCLILSTPHNTCCFLWWGCFWGTMSHCVKLQNIHKNARTKGFKWKSTKSAPKNIPLWVAFHGYVSTGIICSKNPLWIKAALSVCVNYVIREVTATICAGLHPLPPVPLYYKLKTMLEEQIL